MKLRVSILQGITDLMLSGTLSIGLALAIAAAAAAPAVAQYCQRRTDCVPFDQPGDPVWELVQQRAGGDEGRIAVVVDHALYDAVSSGIATYADDLQAEGHAVVAYRFNGPADTATVGLRQRLQSLYDDQPSGSLTGAVLVGHLPHIIYELEHDPYLPEQAYGCFTTDAFFMDLDSQWYKDHCTADDCSEEFYDDWDDSEVEIWVSRIKVDNLVALKDELEMADAQIINHYFERNHQHRDPNLPEPEGAQDTPFDPSENTLAVENSHVPCPPSGAAALEKAFETVASVCGGDVSSQGYIAALNAEPRNYFINLHGHGHGDSQSHQLGDGSFHADDYRTHDPNVIGFSFLSCFTCAFDVENNLGATVAFNPEAATLLVFGFTKAVSTGGGTPVYTQVGAGKSIGESVKALSKPGHAYRLAMVLLGDGTLKPPATTWTGDGDGVTWAHYLNWDSGEVPDGDNHVRIGAADVQVNMGTFHAPHPIWSLTIEGPGASTLGIPSGYGLNPRGPLTEEPWAVCAINMAQGSKLELDRAGLTNATVTMSDGSAPGDTVLNVAGDIDGCGVTVGDYGDVTAGRMENTAVTVGANGSVCVEQAISNSAFTVSEDTTVTADSILAGTSASQDWTLTQAKLEVEKACHLGGDWTISGVASGETYSAEINDVQGNDEYGVVFTLKDGAKVHFESGFTLPGSSGEFQPQHDLVYGLGDNELGGGLEEPLAVTGPSIAYFGDYTRMRALSEGSALNLNLRSELHIASVFEHPFVYDRWDTLGVDITLQPIWAEGEEKEQAIELISPVVSDWYETEPLVFLDLPCHGLFHDLIVPEWDGEGPEPIPVVMRNNYSNEAPDWGEAATLYFENVSIGANRDVKFYSDEGVIRYWGDIYVGPDADLYMDDVILDCWVSVIKFVVGSIYGDWNGDCEITNAELAELQSAIRGGPPTYNPIMDYDCDGVLTNQVELPAFLANMMRQPPCEPECGEGGGGAGAGAGGESGTESWPESYEGYEDVPGLAAWLKEVLSEEQLEAFVEDLTAAAAEFAGTPVGQDLAELLFWLQ